MTSVCFSDGHLSRIQAVKAVSTADLERFLTPATRHAIDCYLEAHPPPGGFPVSEQAYLFWFGFAGNLAYHHPRCLRDAASVSAETTMALGARLGFLEEGNRDEARYGEVLLRSLYDQRTFEVKAQPTIATKGVPFVYALPSGELARLFEHGHRALASYVVSQGHFERGVWNKRRSQKESETLLQLYGWYLLLADAVGPGVDRPLVAGILERLMPRGWRHKRVPVMARYARQLRQMITLEQRLGSTPPVLTGFVHHHLPLDSLERFMESASRRYSLAELGHEQLTQVLLQLFGRYFFLSEIDLPIRNGRVHRLISGMVARGEIPRRARLVVRQAFIDWMREAGDGLAQAATTTISQGEPPLWERRPHATKQRLLDWVREARTEETGVEWELDRGLAESLQESRTSDLLTSGQIDFAKLYRIDVVLHQDEPATGILAESSYRFWLHLIAVLTVYEQGTQGTPLGPDLIRRVLSETTSLDDERLPSASYVRGVLTEIGQLEPLGVPYKSLLQVGSRHLMDLNSVASPWICRLAAFVVEQHDFEYGRDERQWDGEQVDVLLRLRDWYLGFVDDEAIGYPPRLNRALVNGILRQLLPDRWDREAEQISPYYARKLRQLLALERRLPPGEITGYVEGDVPTELVAEAVSLGLVQRPELPLSDGSLELLLLDCFHRYFYLRSFYAERLSLPDNPFARRRLHKLALAMEQRGHIPEGSVAALEESFTELYQYLALHEGRWRRWSLRQKKVGDAPPPELSAPEEEGPWPELKYQTSGPTPEQVADLIWRTLTQPDRSGERTVPVRVLPPAPTASSPVVFEAPPTERPAEATDPWLVGRGGLMEVVVLVEKGLVTPAVVDLCREQLNQCGVMDKLQNGMERLLLNMFAMYRLRGGRLDRPQTGLMEEIAVAVARHGRSSSDPMAQGRKRAEHLGQLIERIRLAAERAGFDIAAAVPEGAWNRLLSEASTWSEPPEEWAAGQLGLAPIQELSRLCLIDPKTVRYLQGLVADSDFFERRKKGVLLQLVNIVAAYQSRHGHAELERRALAALAFQFVRRHASVDGMIYPKQAEDFSVRAISWYRANRERLYPRIDPDVYRNQHPDSYASALLVLSDEQGISRDRHRRLLLMLLSLRHHYREAGGHRRFAQPSIANPIIVHLAAGVSVELIARHRKRLEKLLELETPDWRPAAEEARLEDDPSPFQDVPEFDNPFVQALRGFKVPDACPVPRGKTKKPENGGAEPSPGVDHKAVPVAPPSRVEILFQVGQPIQDRGVPPNNDWLAHRALLPVPQLIHLGFVTRKTELAVQKFLVGERNLSRGERMTRQWCLLNVLAAYELQCGGRVHQADEAVLRRIVDGFAAHGVTALQGLADVCVDYAMRLIAAGNG